MYVDGVQSIHRRRVHGLSREAVPAVGGLSEVVLRRCAELR